MNWYRRFPLSRLARFEAAFPKLRFTGIVVRNTAIGFIRKDKS